MSGGFGQPATAVPAFAGVPTGLPGRAGAVPVVDVVASPPDGRMLTGRAWALVAVAIGIGVVGQVVAWALTRNEGLEPESFIRYGIVIVLGVYFLVGGLIVTRLVPGVSLRWHHGNPAMSIVVGAAVGAGLGFGMLGLQSAGSGHPTGDSRFGLLMSEGDLAHIAISIGIACVCAPLVEEVLFRGLLLESMRTRGAVHATRTALVTSGMAFAVWHLIPNVVVLGYYTVMGLMLGTVYLKRGLVGSMTTHLAFNGVLTVAALAVVLAPARPMWFGDLQMQVPGGWTRLVDESAIGVLEGPSGAGLIVAEQSTPVPPSTETIQRRLSQGMLDPVVPGLVVDAGSVRVVRLPAGPAVEVDLTADGHRGTVVFLAAPGATVEIVFMSGGSMKATTDFARMLDSARVL
jgi:membrane protease YdiL (CAAX protease family)